MTVNRQISLYFPCITGKSNRDWFALDCVHHQHPVTCRNGAAGKYAPGEFT